MHKAPTLTVVEGADDFVNDLDLEDRYGGHSCIDLIARLTECHYRFHYCSRLLTGKSFADRGYGEARELLDIALLHLYKAKWLIGGITGAFKGVRVCEDKDRDAQDGWASTSEVLDIVDRVHTALAAGRVPDTGSTPSPDLSIEGTEVLHADGFPIPPSICPIVVVRGSSYEMGYQYAQQVIEIYGDFVFREFARLRFTPQRLLVLRKHEQHIEAFTPEILSMCRGWADGATDAGLPMAYENVLHLWCSTDEPPASPSEIAWPFLGSEKLLAAMYFGQQAFLNAAMASSDTNTLQQQDSLLEHCSGFCAWGSATDDGKLKCASTTDHDCWIQATIVAYPDEGNAFVYTPFSVHGGWVPGLGLSGMAGHPGMNNRGLAYAHHGGEVHCMEPKETWGYGLPRGASIFHGLRFSDTAAEMHEKIMSYPIGNVGTAMGSVGGQWADRHNGYAYESRYRCAAAPDAVVRTQTFDHNDQGHDFLYTGNSALDARAPSANHLHEEGVLDYDIECGWHTTDPSTFAHPNLMVAAGRMTAGPGGAERNRCFFQLAVPASGTIDDEWMESLYCTAAKDAPAPDETASRHRAILAGRYQAAASPAHRGNAFTALMFPDDGAEGLYSGCIGPLRYDLPSNGASHGYYYYDETNAYWTVRLTPTAEELVDDARQRSLSDGECAREKLARLDESYPGISFLRGFLHRHEEAVEAGNVALDELAAVDSAGDKSATLARALRRFTTAQVRARQVINALSPTQPLTFPE